MFNYIIYLFIYSMTWRVMKTTDGKRKRVGGEKRHRFSRHTRIIIIISIGFRMWFFFKEGGGIFEDYGKGKYKRSFFFFVLVPDFFQNIFFFLYEREEGAGTRTGKVKNKLIIFLDKIPKKNKKKIKFIYRKGENFFTWDKFKTSKMDSSFFSLSLSLLNFI